MASPTLQLSCCSNNSHFEHSETLDRIHHGYQYTSIVSSLFSIVGAIFTLLPRKVSDGIFKKRMIEGPQYNIIKMLAFADLMACIGIICFESLLLCKANDSGINDQDTTGHGFCLFFTAWTQFFYISTYFLTASYAIDVYLMLRRVHKGKLSVIIPVCCFLCPFLLVVIGIVCLYSSTNSPLMCISEEEYLIPLYLASYLPIIAVMLFNPVIYYLSYNKVKPILKGTRGQYTDKERAYLRAVKNKFFLIIAVFIICWWPNIIVGAISLHMGVSKQKEIHLIGLQYIVIFLWFCMAVFNPLQAVLNTLVYVGWGGCCNIALFSCCHRRRRLEIPTNIIEDSDTFNHLQDIERTSFPRTRSLRVNERSPLMRTKPF
ncbi:G-protein coupled receptor 143-like [Antedon mediterranea]|uniref:G-protein coupled receptor 143-like n=1 Tax=Antedon mediterranea TaxID=105859 RepID=UPI003AF682CC